MDYMRAAILEMMKTPHTLEGVVHTLYKHGATAGGFASVYCCLIGMMKEGLIEPRSVAEWNDPLQGPYWDCSSVHGRAKFLGEFILKQPDSKPLLIPMETHRLPSEFQLKILRILVTPMTAREVHTTLSTSQKALFPIVYRSLLILCSYGWIESTDEDIARGGDANHFYQWWQHQQCAGELHLTTLGRDRMSQ